MGTRWVQFYVNLRYLCLVQIHLRSPLIRGIIPNIFLRSFFFTGEAVCPVQPNFRLRSKTTSSSIKLLTSRVSCLIRVFALDFLTWISRPFYSRIFVSIAKPCPSSFETRVNAGLNSTPVVKNVLLDSS